MKTDNKNMNHVLKGTSYFLPFFLVKFSMLKVRPCGEISLGEMFQDRTAVNISALYISFCLVFSLA